MLIRVSRETDPPLERVGLLRGVGQGLGVINQTFMPHVRHLLCFVFFFFFTELDLLLQGVFAWPSCQRLKQVVFKVGGKSIFIFPCMILLVLFNALAGASSGEIVIEMVKWTALP